MKENIQRLNTQRMNSQNKENVFNQASENSTRNDEKTLISKLIRQQGSEDQRTCLQYEILPPINLQENRL